MSLIQGNSIEGAGYEIQKSLRFRASASAYLSRTPTVAGNRKTWTWSGWVKRGALGTQQMLMDVNGGIGGARGDITFLSGDTLQIEFNSSGSAWNTTLITTQVFRDPSAWYHIVIALDTTQATAANRLKLYVNGNQVTTFGTATYPTQNVDQPFNTTSTHNIGRISAGGYYLDGYLTEINFIDGQALDPSYFGEFSAETGAWIPKKYTGAYGTNGFYLPFNDGSNLTNLTADRSGNGNNWTANNISLTSGVTYDWMTDVPTLTSATAANFAVLNPLGGVSSSYLPTNGNLRCYAANSSVNWTPLVATIALQSNFYAEISPSQLDTYWTLEFGITPKVDPTGNNSMGSTANGGVCLQQAYNSSGNTYVTKNSTSLFTFGGGNWSTSDTFMVAYEASTGKVYFGRNGTWYNSGAPASGTGFVTTIDTTITQYFAVGFGAGGFNANFGQRPFAYTPPAGFKALCTKNLPTPSILNPKKHFDVVLATGANIKSTVEALYSDQALMVVKDRANANNWQWFNDVTGLSAILQSNTTSAETTYSAPAGSSVGYGWKAGGAPVTNNAGSIQSQVSANPQAGFSIVTYTGTGANATVGHGLGVAPKMVIVKNRQTGNNWRAWHVGLNVAAPSLYLNAVNAQMSDTSIFNGTNPTASVVHLGNHSDTNAINTYVAYCFAEIPGFSKIGSYTGNGSTDGPFVYCGFRPRFIMVKRTDAAGNSWQMIDTSRDTYNTATHTLYAEQSIAELTVRSFDVLSNGFKPRDNSGDHNASGGTYIYAAFAEAPFQFANAR